ncbi:hypothetical protein J6590_083726 [Homalodisca vitripennis]|nr:hypothetical protein J6590_083726 [Homalodisca vitripennis]
MKIDKYSETMDGEISVKGKELPSFAVVNQNSGSSRRLDLGDILSDEDRYWSIKILGAAEDRTLETSSVMKIDKYSETMDGEISVKGNELPSFAVVNQNSGSSRRPDLGDILSDEDR